MMRLPRFLLLLLLATGPLFSQEEKKPAAPADSTHSVTLIFRHAGSNTPARFTSYMSAAEPFVRMPLLDPRTAGWVAQVDAAFQNKDQPGRFLLEIEDTGRARISPTEQSPFATNPVEILQVGLQLRPGQEILVYKSDQMAISILIEPLGE